MRILEQNRYGYTPERIDRLCEGTRDDDAYRWGLCTLSSDRDGSNSTIDGYAQKGGGVHSGPLAPGQINEFDVCPFLRCGASYYRERGGPCRQREGLV